MKGEQRIGDWKVICDRTGFECWASETVLEWNGLRVRRQSAEQRHPQDFVRGVPDNPTVPFTRPESADVFIATNAVRAEDL